MICTVYIKFEGHNTVVYCNYKEDIDDIISKFCSKTDQNPDHITLYYSGKNLNKYSTLGEIILPNDRNINEIKILAFSSSKYSIKINDKNFSVDPNTSMSDFLKKASSDMDIKKNYTYFCLSERVIYEKLQVKDYLNFDKKERDSIELTFVNKSSDSIKKSSQIICPICGGLAQIKFENNIITIFGCKYSHKIENININEFESTQLIDFTKIICSQCKTKNKFNCMCIYYCSNCNSNFCLSCLTKHDNSHTVVDSTLKFNFCSEHRDMFSFYCKTCEKNICPSCKQSHSYHNIIDFDNIYVSKEEMNRSSEEFKKNIVELRDSISDLTEKKNKIYNLYDFFNNLIKQYNPKIKNYQYMNNFILIKKLIISLEQEVITIKNLNGFQPKVNSFSQSNDIKILEKTNKEYEKIINAYKKENLQYQKDIRMYKSQIKDYENQIANNNNNSGKDESKNKEYEAIISQKDKIIKDYENKSKVNNNKIRIYENQILDFKDIIADYKNKKVKNDHITKDYEDKIKNYENIIADYKIKNEKYENEIKIYENKIKNCDDIMWENEIKIKENFKKIKDYESKIKGLKII